MNAHRCGRATATILLVVVLGLQGCTDDEQPPAETTGTEAASDETDADTTEGDNEEPPAPPPPSPREALAEASGPQSVPILRINSLETTGEYLRLSFQLLVDTSDGNVPISGLLSSASSPGTFDRITLVDSENAVRSFVLRDDAGECICTRDIKSQYTQSNARGPSGYVEVPGFAVFPAQDPGVDSVVVESPGFDPVEVPIDAAAASTS